MRKWICAALALMLLGGTALAEPSEEIAAAQADAAFDAAEAGYAGAWVPFEDGFQLYLPSDWVYRPVTEAQAAAGLFYAAGTGEGVAPAAGVAVSWMRAGSVAGPVELARELSALGAENVRPETRNGIPAVAFEKAADGYRGLSFFHPEYAGYVLTVYVTPVDAAQGDGILASLSPFQP